MYLHLCCEQKTTAAERKRNWQEQMNGFTAELNSKVHRDAHDVFMKQSVALQVSYVDTPGITLCNLVNSM